MWHMCDVGHGLGHGLGHVLRHGLSGRLQPGAVPPFFGWFWGFFGGFFFADRHVPPAHAARICASPQVVRATHAHRVLLGGGGPDADAFDVPALGARAAVAGV